MKDYFSKIESLSISDTLDNNYLLLKAYYRNDTILLANALNELNKIIKIKKQSFSDTSIKPRDLRTLKCEAAFQFEYSAAFCDKAINITISKSHDTVMSEVFLYQMDEFNDRRLIEHKSERLNLDNWSALWNELFISDFWGLKMNNDRSGLDGSDLKIIGFESPVNSFNGRYKYIYRWAAEKSAIGNAFKTALEISNVNVNCFHYK